jgi:hypothetical protein
LPLPSRVCLPGSVIVTGADGASRAVSPRNPLVGTQIGFEPGPAARELPLSPDTRSPVPTCTVTGITFTAESRGDGVGRPATIRGQGFYRLYKSPTTAWLAARGTDTWTQNCGDTQNHPVSGEATLISAWNHRQLSWGEGYDGPYSGDIAVWRDQAVLLHGMDGSGWTVVYREVARSPTSRCCLGGDRRLRVDGRNRTYAPPTMWSL